MTFSRSGFTYNTASVRISSDLPDSISSLAIIKKYFLVVTNTNEVVSIAREFYILNEVCMRFDGLEK